MIRDDVTCVSCARCDGEGSRRETLEYGDGRYSVAGEDSCWLCDGIGVIAVPTMRLWRTCGSPITKPEDW